MRLWATVKPNIMNFGYAIFLTISTASIWGGVFPYLPFDSQTSFVTISFYMAQASAFWVTFLLSCVGSFFFPFQAKRFLVFASGAPLFLGSVLLIAATYIEAGTIGFIVTAAILIGIGSAGFLMMWQRVFASQDAIIGDSNLIIGTGYSALLYLLICTIPIAVTAFVIPLIMIPLTGLCLVLSARTMDLNQPMFVDVPSKHPKVYSRMLRENYRPALGAGVLGFCAGAIRFIAISYQGISDIINIASMIGVGLVSFGFLFIQSRRAIRFDIARTFQILFPIIATCLLILPFAGQDYVIAGSTVAYMTFILAILLVMLHCSRISRDNGVNPAFIYGFFGAIIYCFQSIGFSIGYISGMGTSLGLEQLSFVTISSLYVLSIVLLISRSAGRSSANLMEFLALPSSDTRAALNHPESDSKKFKAIEATESSSPIETVPMKTSRPSGEKHAEATGFDAQDAVIIDRLSKQCQRLRQHYRLSARETEVMELIARGNSVPHIADTLIVSENTVRTHSKRIYTKLDIHKRQELLELLENFKPEYD